MTFDIKQYRLLAWAVYFTIKKNTFLKIETTKNTTQENHKDNEKEETSETEKTRQLTIKNLT